MEKIKLDIYAISYSQSQVGAYILVLGESEGARRLPIIIGVAEAQSIVIAIERQKYSRPLTHDLFKDMATAFDIIVTEVVIVKYAEGIFYAKLVCKRQDEIIYVDSRPSDAVAIAIRFKAPIFAYNSVFDAVGVVDEDMDMHASTPPPSKSTPNEYKLVSQEELEQQLEEAVENEEYEKASKIRDELKKRKKKKK